MDALAKRHLATPLCTVEDITDVIKFRSLMVGASVLRLCAHHVQPGEVAQDNGRQEHLAVQATVGRLDKTRERHSKGEAEK